MSSLPQDITDAIFKAHSENPNNVEAGMEQAFIEVQKCHSYVVWRDSLVKEGIQSQIYNMRRLSNRQWKHPPVDDTPAFSNNRRINHVSQLVEKACKDIMNTFYLGGKCLGDTTGDDLVTVICEEQGKADGHLKNVQFAKWLSSKVKGQQTIRQAKIGIKSIEQQIAKIYGKEALTEATG